MHRRIALVATLLVLLPAGLAHGASRSSFGVNVRSPLETTDWELTRDLRDAARTRARHVRFVISWSELEPRRGELDPEAIGRLDEGFAEARRRGLGVLAQFLWTPCWASTAPPGAECSRFPPARSGDAVFAASWIVRRYARDLVGFEIWNEPDLRNEAFWAGPDKVRRYVRLVRALYRPLKRAAPEVPVLAGAFVGSDGRWLRALYEEGMRGHYDVLSVHFYDLTLTALRRTRRVQRRARDRARVWVSETGWNSCRYRARDQDGHLCTTRASQGRQTADLVRALRRTRWVRAATFYTLRDDRTYDFGLFDRRGRMKPAGRALRAELRTRRPRRTRPLSVRVLRTREGLRVRGTGPGADLYRVDAVGRRSRMYAYARLTPGGRISLDLPRVLGTRGVTVRVRHIWTGRTVTRRV